MVRHQCRYVAFRDTYNIHSFHSIYILFILQSISLQVKNRSLRVWDCESFIRCVGSCENLD